MKKYAVLKNNMVENIIIWDGESHYDTSINLIELNDSVFCGVGFKYENEQFIPNITPPLSDEEPISKSVWDSITSFFTGT